MNPIESQRPAQIDCAQSSALRYRPLPSTGTPSKGRRAAGRLAVFFGIGLLQGCMLVGPDYQTPETKVPDAWQHELTRGLYEGQADLRTWWTVLDDPMLDSLIERATAGNLDLKEAVGRIAQARAQLGIAAGEQLPTVDGIGQAETSRISKEVSEFTSPPQDRDDTFYTTGLDATWEIDFWGRIRRNVESADANLGASIEDYRDTLVVLYSEVAAAYVEVRSLQARIESALGNVKTQQGALQLTRERNRAGLAPDLDVRQAQLNLASTEAFVPLLRQQLASTINSLATLIGEFPSTLHAEVDEPAPIPGTPEETPIGQPAELLRQRPDIRQAERELAAQTAQIGVATANLYPQFTLSGAFAFESFSMGDLFTNDAAAYSFGPAFRWNIFDGGRIRSNINVQDALAQQALASYEQTVLSAVEDVETSMALYEEEKERRDALARSVKAAKESVRLVDTLYRTGLTDFQNVLDTQRSRFEQEDSLEESEGLVTRYLIRIYRALGGGWQPEADEPPATT